MNENFRGKIFFVEFSLLILCLFSFILFGFGMEFVILLAGSIVIVGQYAKGGGKINKVGGALIVVGIILSVFRLQEL
ncbi:hypothetical protein FDP08_11630 [Marinobacter panjinensis]|uniref:Uncharacterized protein n=1 Tax=Marinobacter panjinensis TaxID=2576384 RepID=A0A4U6R705_9GAMM|nr:hypothetical protein [Marinobacter panjinensis]MCR8914478.1 hypothetical protein [Marinobacter panjinensis]TKV68692.1 hypothetical protein FDP08_11630 [Marinobacter panjinensis]